jgi:hypothetical protein
MRTKLSLTSLLFLSSFFAVKAQDEWSGFNTSEYTFLGFSPDLKYAAYEMKEDVAHREVETTLTNIFVINVDKNSYATRHFEFYADSAHEKKYKRAYDSAYKVIQARFNIHGDLLGTPITFGAETKIDSATTSYPFSIAEKKYTLIIKNIPIIPGASEQAQEVMVKVDLRYNGQISTLQAPERAPSSWGITDNYRLLNGYLIQNKIALFLAYETSGFEGPGSRHQMIVTGVLK